MFDSLLKSFTSAKLLGLLGVFACFMPTHVEAKGLGFNIPYGHTHQVSFMFAAGKSADNIAFRACRVMRTKTVAGVPLSQQVLGYALTEAEHCTLETIGPVLPIEMVREFKDRGVFPAYVPDRPPISLSERVHGHSFLLLLASFLLISSGYMLRKKKSSKKRAIRQEVLGIDDPAIFNFIDAMCHAAICDGDIAEEEIIYIRDLARDLTGLDYNSEHIETAIFYCDRLSSKAHFTQFGSSLTDQQKTVILQGALSVLLADDAFTKNEDAFLKNLIKGMSLPKAIADETINTVLQRKHPALGK